MPSTDQIRQQSEQAYKQWCELWRKNAKFHSRFQMKDMLVFQNSGIGKAALLVANGYSFEENIETIKKYRDNVDIFCVDKSLKHLIEHGIYPDFCMLCDAVVSYEKYLEPIKDKLQNTVLFSNVCANTDWTKNGNWKDIYFYINQDILKSELEFAQLSGCGNIIVAGTNVSNALLVLATQSDNNGKNNFFGYDKLLLIGYDYCWDDDKYYAFDSDGDGKQNYMKQVFLHNLSGDFVYSSANLLFSAKWFEKYVKTFNIQAIQCSKRSLVSGIRFGDLSEQMQYRYQPEDSKKVTDLISYRRKIEAQMRAINDQISHIGRDHMKAVLRST